MSPKLFVVYLRRGALVREPRQSRQAHCFTRRRLTIQLMPAVTRSGLAGGLMRLVKG